MRIGIPSEIKPDEYRVALLPVAVEELFRRGHQVLVQSGAGLGSGFQDRDFEAAGRKWFRMLKRFMMALT